MLLETAAIRTVFGAVADFFKSLPREVWYALAALAFLWWFAGMQYDRGYEARALEALEEDLLAQDLQESSANEAAGETDASNRSIAAAQEERDNAIRQAEESDRRPSAGRNAINCQRLREAGRPTDHIPACTAG